MHQTRPSAFRRTCDVRQPDMPCQNSHPVVSLPPSTMIPNKESWQDTSFCILPSISYTALALKIESCHHATSHFAYALSVSGFWNGKISELDTSPNRRGLWESEDGILGHVCNIRPREWMYMMHDDSNTCFQSQGGTLSLTWPDHLFFAYVRGTDNHLSVIH